MQKKRVEEVLKIDRTHLNAYSSGLLQGKAYRILSAHLTNALIPYDLSIPEWKLLGQLNDNGKMKLAELADNLSVEPPRVTSLIDDLEKKNFVLRKNDPNDRRAKVISETKKGEELILQMEPVVKMVMGKLLQGTSPDDLSAYIRVLEAIVDNG